MTIIGREHLGAGDRMLVCNHVGWADPIWVAAAAYPTVVHQMAKVELFRWRWFARLITALGAFPVDRTRPSPSTLKFAVELLRSGGCLLMFPTGTRDQAKTDAPRGAALIASMSGAAIVPVNYSGPKTITLSHLVTRPKIIVRFGPVIQGAALAGTRQSTLQLTRDIDIAMKDVEKVPLAHA